MHDFRMNKQVDEYEELKCFFLTTLQKHPKITTTFWDFIINRSL